MTYTNYSIDHNQKMDETQKRETDRQIDKEREKGESR